MLNTLLDFKVDYDRNAPLAEVVPGIVAAPERYAGMGLKDLGDEMWAQLRKSRQGYWQAQAYATLPKPEMTPRRAFQQLMAGDAEKVPLDRIAGRVAAVGVIPYPPGIPIVMPGENIGAADGPWLTYLRTLQEYGHRFPGFAKEVEGAEEHEGGYRIYCLKKASPRAGRAAANKGRVMAEQKKMNLMQLTFIVAEHDGFRHHRAPTNMAQVGAIAAVVDRHRSRLDGHCVRLRAGRHVQPATRRHGGLCGGLIRKPISGIPAVFPVPRHRQRRDRDLGSRVSRHSSGAPIMFHQRDLSLVATTVANFGGPKA